MTSATSMSSSGGASVSLDYNFPLVGDFVGVLRGDESYVGNRLDAFSSASSQRQDLPAYAKLDLHAGTLYNPWTLEHVGQRSVSRGRSCLGRLRCCREEAS